MVAVNFSSSFQVTGRNANFPTSEIMWKVSATFTNKKPGITAKQGLWFFDSWSLLFGLSIFAHERSPVFHFWNRLRGFSLFSSALVSVLSSAHGFENPKNPLYELTSFIHFVNQSVYTLVLHFYAKRIARTFNDFFDLMTLRQQKRLRVFSICLTGIWIFVHIWFKLVYTISLSSMGIKSWMECGVLISVLIGVDHNIHVLLWVILLAASYYYTCKNSLTKIKMEIMTCKLYESCCRTVVIESSGMHQRISAFNKLCGPPLLLILAYTFVAVSGTLSLLRQTNYGTFIWKMTELVLVFMYCLFIIFLVIMATIFRKNLDDLRRSVLCGLLHQKLSENTVNIKWKLGLTMLSDYKLFEFSVMSLFPLDLNLVLNFTASIITFTILFLQLQSSTPI